MKTIHKYSLIITDEQEVMMPINAEILCVKVQKIGDVSKMYIWALVETNEPMDYRYIRIVGTGNPIEFEMDDYQYVGSVIMDPFVWHVFEKYVIR